MDSYDQHYHNLKKGKHGCVLLNPLVLFDICLQWQDLPQLLQELSSHSLSLHHWSLQTLPVCGTHTQCDPVAVSRSSVECMWGIYIHSNYVLNTFLVHFCVSVYLCGADIVIPFSWCHIPQQATIRRCQLYIVAHSSWSACTSVMLHIETSLTLSLMAGH